MDRRGDVGVQGRRRARGGRLLHTLTAYYLLPTTYCLLLTTYDLRLATHYLLLATCYSLLLTMKVGDGKAEELWKLSQKYAATLTTPPLPLT